MRASKFANGMPSPISLKRELTRATMARNAGIQSFARQSFFDEPNRKDGFKSDFFDPFHTGENYYGNLCTADGRYNREVDCQTLRRVSKKAWIINLCITSVQRKIKPFLKPSTNRNLRGFVLHKTGEDVATATGHKSKEREVIEAFLRNTGMDEDSDRDNFMRFCVKTIRDALEIDQVAAEVCYTRAGKPYAFMAVDAATIEKVMPNQENPDNIKFVQVVDGMPRAYYPEGTLVFDYQNPRTDLRFSAYGYSYVAQAIDLITGSINAFTYNAGFFTENKLPRGMLLLDGNANQETVEQMEDYICDVMSGQTSNQWRIPIIPSGSTGGDNNSIKWVALAGTNKEMEFQGWLDFLTSGIVSLFGCSMEELGLHSSKSQPMFEHNDAPQIEASKSSVLGDTLSFLQQYVNRIIALAFPGWELEFVGYEKDDPKQILDLAKGELESYKTLNEVRKEKGLPALEGEWANECPANPQFLQMYQAAKGQEQGEDEGGEDMGDMGEEGDEGEDEGIDNDKWGDIEDNAQGKDDGGDDEGGEEGDEENGDDAKEVHKSLNVW